MKTVALVTGGTGFIGSHLCNKLYENNYHVIAVGFSGENTPNCHQLYRMPLDQIPHSEIGKIDICFHQAANNDTLDSNLDKMLQANVIQPSTLFRNLLQQNNCKNFVYASSCSVYGNQPCPFDELETNPEPLNPYAVSKLEFEKFASDFGELHGLQVVGLRYTNVYGLGEDHKGRRASMLSQMLNKIQKDETVNLFRDGEQERDWIYVDDVVNANIKASEAKESGLFNVGYSMSYSFNFLVKLISDKLRKKPMIEYIDCSFQDQYQSKTSVRMFRTKEILHFVPKWSPWEALDEMIKKATS